MTKCDLCTRDEYEKDLGIIRVTTQNMGEEMIAKHGDYFNIRCCNECWNMLEAGESIIILCEECKRPEIWSKRMFQDRAKDYFDNKTIVHLVSLGLTTVEMPLCNKCAWGAFGQIGGNYESH